MIRLSCRSYCIVLGGALTALLVGCDEEASVASRREDFAAKLEGTWQSACIANPPDAQGAVSYFQATLINRGRQADAEFRYTLFGDQACGFKLATFRNTNRPELLAPRDEIAADTWEIDVNYTGLFATAHVEGFATTFASAGCGSGGWSAGVEQSIAATGCLTFEPLARCAADHDIFSLSADGATLQNGVRLGDLCLAENRPSQLNTWTFARQP
jgi:hypothetical protein